MIWVIHHKKVQNTEHEMYLIIFAVIFFDDRGGILPLSPIDCLWGDSIAKGDFLVVLVTAAAAGGEETAETAVGSLEVLIGEAR